MGRRLLHSGELCSRQTEYGKGILATLSQELSDEFGPGYSYSALTRMVKFAEVFPEGEIVATLSQQLSWSHFRQLLPLEQPLQRDFYAEMCRVERWSVRTLRDKIDAMLFERTAISKKPDELAKAEIAALRAEDQISPSMVFRDPYLLDFLGLNDRYIEKDLENAILREIETFLLELGRSGIHVAEYLTALPSRELLQQKLHDAIEISQARLEAKKRETE